MSRHIYHDAHGNELTEDEALDENEIIKDGVGVRVRLAMRDSAGHRLVDAAGEPLPTSWGRSGFVFSDTSAERRIEDRDFHKAKLSAAWKGGLEQGDTLTIGGNRFEVLGYRDNGQMVLADATGADGDELKQQAYNTAVAELSDAWRTRAADGEGDSCTTGSGDRGRWVKGKNGKLVCKAGDREPSDNEWNMSGPLSDSIDVQSVRDEAYAESVETLRNAWKR